MLKLYRLIIVEINMFFDNASTTKMDNDILEGMMKLNEDCFYNPGALYTNGRKVRSLIDESREVVKKCLNFDGDVIFTGSATEANNLAVHGSVNKRFKKVLVSVGEHPSIYNSIMELKNRGYDVETVNLTSTGIVDEKDFINKMTNDVGFVSVMYVSNETGAVNDIERLVSIAKDINPKVIFHCDGVQAVGKIPVDVDGLGVDLFTVSAHKIHGMKGVGALLVRKGVLLKPMVYGGGQEYGLRSGTENLMGIVSLSMAIEKECKSIAENYAHVAKLKNILLEGLKDCPFDYQVFSDVHASPYIVSIGFKNCRAETLLNMLNDEGVMVGNGSACSSKKSGNRVLESMGFSKDYVEGNIRISFSKDNTAEETYSLVNCLKNVVVLYLNKAR